MHSTPNLIPVSRCLLLMVCHLQFSSVCVFDVAKDALKKNKFPQIRAYSRLCQRLQRLQTHNKEYCNKR